MSAAGVTAAAAPLIARTALALDEEDYSQFLALCSADFRYEVRTWSPELRKWMTWLAQSRTELEALFATLPEHLRRRGRLLRQLGPTILDVPTPDGVRASTSFAIYHTDLEGRTRIWAVGRYRDRIVPSPHGARLTAREVVLDTRDLGIGSHVPL